jgi:hypothetical protein
MVGKGPKTGAHAGGQYHCSHVQINMDYSLAGLQSHTFFSPLRWHDLHSYLAFPDALSLAFLGLASHIVFFPISCFIFDPVPGVL